MTNTAVTIGNLDGVHLGHAALIRAAREAVGPSGRVVALAFDPHPLTVLRPAWAPTRLSTFEQRRGWLRAIGADEVKPLRPDRELLELAPEAFLRRLCETDGPAFIVEGGDFNFGRNRAGSVETLRELGPSLGFEPIVVPPVEVALTEQAIVRVSSSLTRWLLERGRVVDAARLLDRPYELIATVRRGAQRGRTIGFPTMNVALDDQQIPADGVYAGHAVLPDGERFVAAVSVGTNPTFEDASRTCEAHLLDYDGPLDHYGWTLQLSFRAWLRDQVRYPGVEPLIEQLHRDVDRTRALVGPLLETA